MQNIDEDITPNFFEDRSKIIAVVLFLAGLFVLAIGLGLVFFKSQPKESDVVLITSSPGVVNGAKTSNEIVVDIDGAVARPGLYKSSSDARVNDLIVLAGGLLDSADRAQVNLAGKIVDGQKIHIPEIGEVPITGFGKLNSTLVSINNGSELELESLPQVGPATVTKIVAGRPYGSLEELVSRKAVSKSVFEKIKDLVSL